MRRLEVLGDEEGKPSRVVWSADDPEVWETVNEGVGEDDAVLSKS
jgi:hypothetical protein